MRFDSLALVEQKEIIRKALQAYVASSNISAGKLYSVGVYDWMVVHGYVEVSDYPDAASFWEAHWNLTSYTSSLWTAYLDSTGKAVSGGLVDGSIWRKWYVWALIALAVFLIWKVFKK